MRLPSWNHDENAWKSSFIHLVEVQDHLVSRCREYGASSTTGRDETDEQVADVERWIDFSGFCFPETGALCGNLLSL